jgi:hypothetical protein
LHEQLPTELLKPAKNRLQHMSQPSLTRYMVAPETLKGLRNAKPSTYPAEPIDPTLLVSKSIAELIPKRLWEGDWVIDRENDIEFLENHFTCGVGDYLWIAEKHRLHILDDRVVAEYGDGEKRTVLVPPSCVPFKNGRNIPPIGMRREACRFIVRVHEVGVKWTGLGDKKTELMWVVGVERMPDPDMIIDQFKRGLLK